MFRLNLSIIFLLVATVILAACGNQSATPQAAVPPPPTATVPAATATTPPTTQAQIDTPVPTPTNIPTSTEIVATETMVPTPTDTPIPAPTEAPPTQSNPDLNFAQVVFVSAKQNSGGLWQFDTTVRHNDEGWDHYADAWQVVDLDGNLLAERVLLHPHETEQPFTRSQSSIEIPAEMTQVIVQAKCNVHGFGGQEILVDLTANNGENFEVNRP
jgi:hypothetical protein